MNPKKWRQGFLAITLIAWMSGCDGGMNSRVVQTRSGTVFVTGTDAPLPSVVSFQVDITGMMVTDTNNNPQSVFSATQTEYVARLNGLWTLLDINTIPTGTYNSVTVTLANPKKGT